MKHLKALFLREGSILIVFSTHCVVGTEPLPAPLPPEQVNPSVPQAGTPQCCVPPRGGLGAGAGSPAPRGRGCHLALLWVSRGGAVAVAQRLHLRAGVRLLHPGWHCRAPLDARRRYGPFWGAVRCGPLCFTPCRVQHARAILAVPDRELLAGRSDAQP